MEEITRSLCSMRYAYLEQRLPTQIQKMALALLFDMKFPHAIDFKELFRETQIVTGNSSFFQCVLFPLFPNESSKLLTWMMFNEGVPNNIDWLKLSKESDLPVIIIDKFGIYLNWEDVVMNSHTPLPMCLIEKYQALYDKAIINLLFNS